MNETLDGDGARSQVMRDWLLELAGQLDRGEVVCLSHPAAAVIPSKQWDWKNRGFVATGDFLLRAGFRQATGATRKEQKALDHEGHGDTEKSKRGEAR